MEPMPVQFAMLTPNCVTGALATGEVCLTCRSAWDARSKVGANTTHTAHTTHTSRSAQSKARPHMPAMPPNPNTRLQQGALQ
jgi:hypothetical protein